MVSIVRQMPSWNCCGRSQPDGLDRAVPRGAFERQLLRCRRSRLHFMPIYFPHLKSVGRFWGLMYKHITRNRSDEGFAIFRMA